MNFHHESLENVLAEMNTIEDVGLASNEVKKRAEKENDELWLMALDDFSQKIKL